MELSQLFDAVVNVFWEVHLKSLFKSHSLVLIMQNQANIMIPALIYSNGVGVQGDWTYGLQISFRGIVRNGLRL